MSINTTGLFDIPEEIVYLNCGSLSPQLKSVTEAGVTAVTKKASPWNIRADDWFSFPEQLRSLVAKIIHTDAEGMALVPSVSYGISIAAANLPVHKDQHIVLMDQEYPSNYYAWSELAKTTGAKIVTVKKEDRTWTEALLEAIDEKTAIVAVSNCHWTNGSLVDLQLVSDKTRSVGAALVIDASQSMGVHPLDISAIQPDFLVSVGYKWLLGPYNLGYLYAAPKWRKEGRPIEYSWLTKNDSENFAGLVNYRDDFRPGARRFDMGEFPSFIHVAMAIAALTQVLEWGVENIRVQLRTITQKIQQEATPLGLQFPDSVQRVDHMIGLDLPGGIPDALKADLQKANIFVGYRGKSIRVSPYLHTRKEDIDKLFAVIRRHVGSI